MDGKTLFLGHSWGAELDVLLIGRNRRTGIEIKYTYAPKMTKSMRIAMKELSLDRSYVIYPGKTDYDLDNNVSVVSATGMDRIFASSNSKAA